MLRDAVLFSIAIVAFDGLGALIARAFSFSYGQFAILALVIFVAMGVYAGRTLPPGRAAVAILVAAVAESTLGWYVSWQIGAARLAPGTAESTIVFTAIAGAAIDALFGGIGVFFGRRSVLPQKSR